MDQIEKRIIEKIAYEKFKDLHKELNYIYATIVENEAYTKEQMLRAIECEKILETINDDKSFTYSNIDQVISHFNKLAAKKRHRELNKTIDNLYDTIIEKKSFTEEEIMQLVDFQKDLYQYRNIRRTVNIICSNERFRDWVFFDPEEMRKFLTKEITSEINYENNKKFRNEIKDIEETIVKNKTYSKEQIQRIAECEKLMKM